METAVIVLVAGGGGSGAIFTVSAALPPVVEETEGDEERDEDEGDREDEVTLRAAHLMLGREVTPSLSLALATELLDLGGVEDVRGVGALAAVVVTGANHPLPPHPSYPLPSNPRPG